MKENQEGFSLMEALISVLVLSIGLLGLGQLQARLWTSAGDIRSLGDAYLLSENLLEISALGWLPPTTAQNLVTQSEPAISVTLDQLDPGQDNSSLRITRANLNWRRPSDNQSLSVSNTVNTGLSAGDTRWLLPWN